MSQWCSIRAIFDIAKGSPSGKGLGSKLYYNNCWDTYEAIGIEQIYKTALASLRYEKDTFLTLGSEDGVDITIKTQEGSSIFFQGRELSIDDRGQLVVIGDLRDCTREELVPRLNKFIKHLRGYGIRIEGATVSIR